MLNTHSFSGWGEGLGEYLRDLLVLVRAATAADRGPHCVDDHCISPRVIGHL
jgi:hypothetical protein